MTQLIYLVTAASIFFASCSNEYKNEEFRNNQKKEGNMETKEVQSFVQSDQNKYSLKFESDLNSVEAGKNFNLAFILVSVGDIKKIITLETIHERKVHLIIVSEDLEYFNHIHPTKEDNGHYSVDFNIPFGGSYKLFAEYKPEGNNKITDVFDFMAAGVNKPYKIYESQKTSFSGNEYSVKLLNAENLMVGKENMIIAEFYKDGKKLNINKLENYLGEKAHAVAVSIKEKNFMHVHPMVMAGELNLHLDFDKPDFYRLWLQFKINGVVYTADFVVKAIESDQKEKTTNQHKHH
jgi:hypothetical protein